MTWCSWSLSSKHAPMTSRPWLELCPRPWVWTPRRRAAWAWCRTPCPWTPPSRSRTSPSNPPASSPRPGPRRPPGRAWPRTRGAGAGYWSPTAASPRAGARPRVSASPWTGPGCPTGTARGQHLSPGLATSNIFNSNPSTLHCHCHHWAGELLIQILCSRGLLITLQVH